MIPYFQIICYRREGDKLIPYRYSGAHGFISAVEITMPHLFKGHANWLADQISPRIEMKQAA